MASAAAVYVPPRSWVARAFSIRELKHSLIAKATMLDACVSNLAPMMGTYGQRLDQAIQLAGKQRQHLADAIGISVQAIAQVIAGKTRALTAENSARAARYLQVEEFWLATGEGEPRPAGTRMENNWPFPRVDLRRVERLSPEERAFVEAKLESALEAAESRIGAAKSAGRARG